MSSLIIEHSKLFQSLKALHIETGKLGNNEILAWHDTFNRGESTFLEWIENKLGADNCLSYTETEAHSELLQKELFVECTNDQDLREWETEYVEVLKYDPNEFDSEFLEAECDFYAQEVKYLEEETSNANHNERTRCLLSKFFTKSRDAEFQYDQVEPACLREAEHLDHLFANFKSKFMDCCNFINNITNFSEVQLLCMMIIEKNTVVELDKDCTMSHSLNSFDSQNCNSTLHYTLMHNWQRILCINSVYLEALECMGKQLFKGLYNFICNIVEIQVQNNLLIWLNESSQGIQLKQGCNSEELLTYIQEDEKIEVDILEVVQNLIHEQMMMYKKEDLNDLIAKIKYASIIEEKLENLLQYQRLIFHLLSIEIKKFDAISNLKEKFRMCMKDMQQSKARIDGMMTVISDFNIYASKPIEEKWHPLAGILKTVGIQENLSFMQALQAIEVFDENLNALKWKIFIGDINLMASKLQNLDKTNKAMFAFLNNNMTGTLSVRPSDIFYALRNAADAVTKDNKVIKYFQNLPKEIMCKLDANKWLRIKRQLWMYFLLKPDRVVQLLEEISEAVRTKRASFLSMEMRGLE